jgi:hypothetical protein
MISKEKCSEEDIFYTVYYFNQSVLDACSVLLELKPKWLELGKTIIQTKQV